MQLLPDRENNKPLAVGLVLIVLLLVYMLGFHWFVVRHGEISDRRADLENQVARFKAASARRPMLEQRLDELRADRLDSALFLPQGNFNTAAAGLVRTLRDVIVAEADSDELCRIVSTQNRPDPEPDRFEQVTVQVRMNCPLPDLVGVLYALENNVPLVFVDNVLINQRMTADRRRARGSVEAYGQLDVRFEMYGFLGEPLGARP